MVIFKGNSEVGDDGGGKVPCTRVGLFGGGVQLGRGVGGDAPTKSTEGTEDVMRPERPA